MWVAVERFADAHDGNHIYEAGDRFPRPGFTVTEERLAELSGWGNRLRHPLITQEKDPEQPVKTTRKRVKKDA